MSIQLKRSLTADINNNHVLKQGQVGIEMPTTLNTSNSPFKIKIGDGSSAWESLPYIAADTSVSNIWTDINTLQDGSDDFATIFSNLPDDVHCLVFPSGSYTFKSECTIPVPCLLLLGCRLTFSGTSGAVTFQHDIIAGNYPIFYSSDFVIPNEDIYLDWWNSGYDVNLDQFSSSVLRIHLSKKTYSLYNLYNSSSNDIEFLGTSADATILKTNLTVIGDATSGSALTFRDLTLQSFTPYSNLCSLQNICKLTVDNCKITNYSTAFQFDGTDMHTEIRFNNVEESDGKLISGHYNAAIINVGSDAIDATPVSLDLDAVFNNVSVSTTATSVSSITGYNCTGSTVFTHCKNISNGKYALPSIPNLFLKLEDCQFSTTASGYGITANCKSVTISNCIFNFGTFGNFELTGSSFTFVKDCTITARGMYLGRSSTSKTTYINCKLNATNHFNNSMSSGFANLHGSYYNCDFSDTVSGTASTAAVGIYNIVANFVNCTFNDTMNVSFSSSSGYNSRINLINCNRVPFSSTSGTGWKVSTINTPY